MYLKSIIIAASCKYLTKGERDSARPVYQRSHNQSGEYPATITFA